MIMKKYIGFIVGNVVGIIVNLWIYFIRGKELKRAKFSSFPFSGMIRIYSSGNILMQAII